MGIVRSGSKLDAKFLFESLNSPRIRQLVIA